MDSVTQIALGAAVGGLVAHKQLGWRAYLVGAALGTLPDMDVLIRYDTAIDDVTRHRGFSHSLFVLTAVSPLLSWLVSRWLRWQNHPMSLSRTLLLCWLCLITHPLLDACTSYGTQLWWPLQPPPTSWSSIFIIDPLYTLPLLLGAIIALRRRKTAQPQRGYRSNLIGLCIASSYLMVSLILAQQMRGTGQQLAAQQQLDGQVFVTPTPFNIALWRIVVVDSNHWYSAYISIFDSNPPQLQQVAELNHQLGAGLADVERLAWFTNGFYQLAEEDNRLIATDLRLGVEPVLPFRFVVAEQRDGQWQAQVSQRLESERPRREQLQWLWQRASGKTDTSPMLFDYQQAP